MRYDTAVIAEKSDSVARMESPPASTVLTRHMGGLDLLRGSAILAVVIFHGCIYSAPRLVLHDPILRNLYALTAWGRLGVNLFFILSGFLITGLLLDGSQLPNYYSRFYSRRALRILPAYVITLCLIWAFGFVRLPYVMVCLLFMANMPGLLLHSGYVVFGPLWSLAVEEQFYLLWPWFMRHLKPRSVIYVCLMLMVLCPALRWLAASHLLYTGEPQSKTWMVADNIAIGGLLAALTRIPSVSRSHLTWIGWAAAGVGALGASVLAVTHNPWTAVGMSLQLSFFMLIGVGLVVWMLCAFRERRLPAGLRWLVFLGEISYGLYLIHMLCFQLYDRYTGGRGLLSLRAMGVRFVIAAGMAVILATLSRRTVEQRMLDLKYRLRLAR
jgi:peptidoglycan/LPS O-acetylase OafA/YrhL